MKTNQKNRNSLLEAAAKFLDKEKDAKPNKKISVMYREKAARLISSANRSKK